MVMQAVSVSGSNPSPERIFALGALFQGPFSIDWIQGLARTRVSLILEALDEGIRKGLLTEVRTGFYEIRDPEERRRLLCTIPEGEIGRLHREAAEMLLIDVRQDAEFLPELTHHLLRISNTLEGCRRLGEAGSRYLHHFEYDEALQCYTKLIQDIEVLRGEEADRLLIQAAITYSKISTATHAPMRVIGALKKALSRAASLEDRTSQALIEMHLAKNQWLQSRYGIAMKHFERGRSIAREVDDPRLLRSMTTFSAFFLYWQGRYREAVDVYEKSVSEIDKFPEGNFPLLAGTIVGQCYCYIGHVTQGLGMIDAIRTHCLEMGDHHTAAYASCGLGTCLIQTRRVEDAETYLKNTVFEAEKGHNEWAFIMGVLCLAFVDYLKGETDKAVAGVKAFFRKSAQVRLEVRPLPVLMDLCWAVERGELPPIRGLSLQGEIERALRGGNVHMEGMAYLYQARIAVHEGREHAFAVRKLRTALKRLESSGHCIAIEEARLDLAREYLRNGRESDAMEMMREACASLARIDEGLIPEEMRHFAWDSRCEDNLLQEILRLGQEVVSIRNTKDLALRIISTVNRITGAERGAVFLIDKNADPMELELRAAKNMTSEEIRHPDFRVFMDLIRKTVQTGEGRIYVNRLQNPGESGSGKTIRSCICVPMILRDKCVGVLYHDNRLFSNLFKEEDLRILSYFAGQAAIAMDNARVYEEIRRINQKLKEEKQYYEEQHLESLHFENIVGRSRPIMQVFDHVERVAGTDTTVLILGETGVGKELVARAIHRNSPRCERPFIRLHCSALPESLITSELFGHEKGAFTGATKTRIGRFELADGGTLFLDEVGDIPMEVQVRLLRVLQSKEFERVGGKETLHSDFRLLVATNRDLRAQVRKGAFREDLYYRLNVFPIVVPSLRERKEDIPLLAYYFLKLYATKMGKSLSRIPDAEMQKLVSYDWPGNVRELENVMERGTILGSGMEFKVPGLTPWTFVASPGERRGTLKENERLHIQWALKKTGGKIRGPGGAAELLDIHHNTLYSRMKKLGIRPKERLPSRKRF